VLFKKLAIMIKFIMSKFQLLVNVLFVFVILLKTFLLSIG